MRHSLQFSLFLSSYQQAVHVPLSSRMPWILLFATLSILTPHQCAVTVTERNSLLRNAGIDLGVAMSFVDYNGDRNSDIIYLDADGITLNVALLHKDNPVSEKQFLLKVSPNAPIRSVIAGDFNGDSKVDLLLLLKLNDDDATYQVVLGLHPETHEENITNLIPITTVHNLPLALDYNADGIMDLLVELVNKSGTTLWLGQNNDAVPLKEESIDKISGHWGSPGYSGFLDALSNFRPGIFLYLDSGFKFFANEDGKYQFSAPTSISYPGNALVYGVPVFADWNGVGKMSLLLPYCKDTDCAESHLSIYNFQTSSWSNLNISWGDWKLALSSKVSLATKVVLPTLLPARVGDFNLDRYPDLLTVLQSTKNAKTRSAVVFLKDGNSMSLNVLDSVESTVSDAAFFDVNEDSILDIITMHDTDSGTQLQVYTQTSDTTDNYFLKVMVLTGRCSSASSCNLPGNQKLPYGMPVPGATLKYLTEGVHGDSLYGMAVLCTTSSYQALQLPFYLFGLGSYANYVEELKVAMATNTQSTREHDFTFIVPKTQVVIIPYPLDQPTKWKYLLYIDPFHDKKVIFVAVALLSVALVVVIVISILQYLEYREDKLEKLKDVQKFSFDAM